MKAPRNRTMTLSEHEKENYKCDLIKLDNSVSQSQIENKIAHQDLFEVLPFLPSEFVDLLFIDPPYNLTKNFNGRDFKKRSTVDYIEWIDSWLSKMIRTLKPTASVYICGDWRSSTSVYHIVEKYLTIRNRITFEREKGRGSKRNWKNSLEDIWFCTLSDHYTFNVEAVKLKRQVIAPYRENGQPKD